MKYIFRVVGKIPSFPAYLIVLVGMVTAIAGFIMGLNNLDPLVPSGVAKGLLTFFAGVSVAMLIFISKMNNFLEKSQSSDKTFC